MSRAPYPLPRTPGDAGLAPPPLPRVSPPSGLLSSGRVSTWLDNLQNSKLAAAGHRHSLHLPSRPDVGLQC